MGSKSSKPQRPAASVSSASSSERASSQAASIGSVNVVFVEMPELVESYQKQALQAVQKWSTKWGMPGKKVEQTPSFMEYSDELKVLAETSAMVRAYGHLGRYGNQTDSIRALVVLYDDMTKVFKQDLKTLRKTRESKDETVNATLIKSCTRRAETLRSRLEALVPNLTSTPFVESLALLDGSASA